ncbi:MAG TPA: type II toxin-antitoxin system MqsR family toxin [Rhodocyclaceae bacterium]|nr:type II toxin-antitoxin system MqsR family toxin [Rhodocyclaceae bacterium]
MEKKKPHYDLAEVKRLVAISGISAFTQTAQDGVARLGLLPAEAVQLVLSIERRNFFKSMTTHARHDVWQDVYHLATRVGVLYVKVTVLPGTRVVIQFKER